LRVLLAVHDLVLASSHMRHAMAVEKVTLFLSGFFFGGLVDHAVLAVTGFETTPFGVHVGVVGNWIFAGLDAGLAALLYELHRRAAKRTDHGGEHPC
jgi:hypothetical protein